MDFLDNAVSQLIGTAIALVGGIPTALYIDRLKKAGEEKKQRDKEKHEARQVLESIKEELLYCSFLLNDRLEKPGKTPTTWMKVTYWKTVNRSGLLTLIRDPILLASLDSVYYWIEETRSYEQTAYMVSNTAATIQFRGGGTSTQYVMEDLRRHYDRLPELIGRALAAIDANVVDS